MASINRRQLITLAGATTSAGVLGPPSCGPAPSRPAGPTDEAAWSAVRQEFALEPDWIQLAGLLFAAHPRPVREAIEEHRRGFDANPALYVTESNPHFEREVPRAAAQYLGVSAEDIILTDSTTMGIGLVYSGLVLREGQELLTTEHDYHATHDALDERARRSRATVRRITLYEDSAAANADEMVARLAVALRPATRVVALTWVHSSTGVKLPLRQMASAIASVNRGRETEDRILLCVDGVHGLGVEDVDLGDLGCDFFMAGTHKWLFGPRGTGIVWGAPSAHGALRPSIPSFTREIGWGGALTPGGFHSFEHRWALAPAFDWNRHVGRARIAERVRHLATQFKQALGELKHVTLKTPMSPELSAGIIAFEVKGVSSIEVERRLKAQGIVSAHAPYSPSYARLTPGLLNDPSEIEPTISAIAALA
jgi:selenocysteine lyase/cysteine desulfurase